MQLLELAETSRAVGEVRARTAKVERLAQCLVRLAPGEVETAVAWLAGALPQGRIGAGSAALRAAVAAPAPGSASLSLLEVDRELGRIAGMRGAGSAAERARALGALFARASAVERDFLAPLLLGELRQGALEGLMLDAIARAARVSAAEVRRAAMLCGSAAPVAAAALEAGAAGLARFRIEVQRPLQPMLAQTAEGLGDALSRWPRCALEWKLDGARIQLHRLGDEVRIFTRSGLDVSAAVPELVLLARRLPVESAILDGEAIALGADARPRPFQIAMRRFGRRLDVERLREEIPLAPFYFDCLHLDGVDWIDRPAHERIGRLAAAVPAEQRVPRIETSSLAEGEAFLAGALGRGHEGVMAKALDAPYEAGRRGAAWIKVKPEHTLDLVVLAAEWGSGRRRGWLSNLHLGARDPAGGFVMLGKTFKGLSDAMLEWQTRRLLELEVAREGAVVRVRRELVVEIAFDGVQASPTYAGGLALRFARVRRHRPDKRAEDADPIDAVRAAFDASPK